MSNIFTDIVHPESYSSAFKKHMFETYHVTCHVNEERGNLEGLGADPNEFEEYGQFFDEDDGTPCQGRKWRKEPRDN